MQICSSIANLHKVVEKGNTQSCGIFWGRVWGIHKIVERFHTAKKFGTEYQNKRNS